MRLRADPERVRVATWKQPDGQYQVKVENRADPAEGYWAVRDTPEEAVEAALVIADANCLAGVDLGCNWSYDHPWKKDE